MEPAEAVTAALAELERARAAVRRARDRQVRRTEHRDALRALAFQWFQSYRKIVGRTADTARLSAVNTNYQTILDAAEKNSARATYLTAMGAARGALIDLRAHLMVADHTPTGNDDRAPDFSPLVSDEVMRGILERRWHECARCVNAQAPLASIVMMGGLLEAMFVARANQLVDKSVLVKASSAPKDPKTKKVVDIRDWTLRPYIDVGHELKWITRSAKDVAAVLSEYRNYIHPEKERRHNVILEGQDVSMLWGVTKSLVQQLLQSAK